jgi:hypothetical protein
MFNLSDLLCALIEMFNKKPTILATQIALICHVNKYGAFVGGE